MEKFAFLFICLLQVLVHLSTGQHHLRARIGPWKHRVQWENNGRVYSLMTTGTEYRSPIQARRHPQLFLTTKRTLNRHHPPGVLSRSSRTRSADLEERQRNRHSQVDASVLGADAGHYILATGLHSSGARSQPLPRIAPTRESVVAGHPGARRPLQPTSNGTSPIVATIQEFSGSGVPRGGRSPSGDDGSPPVPPQQITASPTISQDFTHSRGAGMRLESPESTVRPTTTAGFVNNVEDGGNGRRVQQQSSLGDTQSAQRAHSITRVIPETNVFHTALSNNAVETHFPRPRSERTRSASNRSNYTRDPHGNHHRNSVFYNMYPTEGRSRAPVRHPPGTGYGTRFFHNGMADWRISQTCNLNQIFVFNYFLLSHIN